MRRLAIAISLAIIAVALFAIPASATVHEIVGQQCSGRAELLPPGVTGGSNADNFAQPLFAMGFVDIEPYPEGPGVLLTFDFDHPASKIAPTGEIIDEGGGFFVQEWELDSDHPFTNCKELR